MNALHPLRLNPPDRGLSFAHMSGNVAFVVRSLPSSVLDGAFRVHLSPDALEKAGLKLGDLCLITGENGSSGYGIAWRAMDKMGNSPKVPPVKMTDIFRNAFGFKEGSHVTIAKSAAKIQRANVVTLTDVTPSDYGNAAELDGYGRWRNKCVCTLSDAEAIAVGMTFDVTAKKGLKKRFYVEHIQAADVQAGGLHLYDDASQVVLGNGGSKAASTIANGDALPALDTTRIGGLIDQIKELNERLDRVLHKESSVEMARLSTNRHILLHGYEGTGKSLLLDKLEQTSACRVYRLERADMTTGKIQSTIQATFKDAIASQPSVVIMDDFERLASPDNEAYSNSIERELKKLRGHNVLVVAATRSLTSIDSKLTRGGCFSKKIELPIPDVADRKQILNVLIGNPAKADDSVTTMVSARTHGFTGVDLELLVEEATDAALSRVRIQPEKRAVIQSQGPVTKDAIALEDGLVCSQDLTTIESPTLGSAPNVAVDGDDRNHDMGITAADFEVALTSGGVGPTALREIFLETPRVRWSDIGGSEDQQQRFDEIIGWPLQEPELCEQLNILPQKGVLLYGPPGCSKTMTAQAVATTYDLNFIAVKGAELISMYVGESERAVREIFRKAKQAAPCIIFFDEIDSIGSARESGGTKGLNVLTTLLNEMDGFETMKDVLVLAATNKPESLDKALMRPGRFDQHVYVGLPTAQARRDIIEISLSKSRVVPTADIESMVATTAGHSGAEIVAICEMAKRSAFRKKAAIIEDEDLREAARVARRGVTDEMLKGYEDFAAAGASS